LPYFNAVFLADSQGLPVALTGRGGVARTQLRAGGAQRANRDVAIK